MSRSTVVDNSPHQPKVEGSNPTAASGSGLNKMAEKVVCPEQKIFFNFFHFSAKTDKFWQTFCGSNACQGTIS
jgi:hypothetical protein